MVRSGYLDGGPLSLEPVDFAHPRWVLYSCAATGLPKAIVRSQGAILVEQTREMLLHRNAQPQVRVFWFTTTGCMMWNFLIGALLTEASIVLFDGSPDRDVLWPLAAESKTTVCGASGVWHVWPPGRSL